MSSLLGEKRSRQKKKKKGKTEELLVSILILPIQHAFPYPVRVRTMNTTYVHTIGVILHWCGKFRGVAAAAGLGMPVTFFFRSTMYVWKWCRCS